MIFAGDQILREWRIKSPGVSPALGIELDNIAQEARISDARIYEILDLKGQYHAIFSNTLKIEKTLFGW